MGESNQAAVQGSRPSSQINVTACLDLPFPCSTCAICHSVKVPDVGLRKQACGCVLTRVLERRTGKEIPERETCGSSPPRRPRPFRPHTAVRHTSRQGKPGQRRVSKCGPGAVAGETPTHRQPTIYPTPRWATCSAFPLSAVNPLNPAEDPIQSGVTHPGGVVLCGIMILKGSAASPPIPPLTPTQMRLFPAVSVASFIVSPLS